MKLTNTQIYNYAINLNEAFKDTSQKLPIKINFYLQKNKAALTSLAQDIETARLNILRQYGSPSEDGDQYIIPKENIEEAQQELNDLLALEQEVNIYTIDINNLGDDLALTTGQMEAILFMID